MERIQAMIFQRSCEVWMALPMGGIGLSVVARNDVSSAA